MTLTSKIRKQRTYKLQHSLLAVLLLLPLACSKETDLQIRFQNNYSKTINNVVIGPDNFGNVAPGQTTAYISIPDGSGTISGVTSDSLYKLTGTYSVTEHGKHSYTATLDSAGTIVTSVDN